MVPSLVARMGDVVFSAVPRPLASPAFSFSYFDPEAGEYRSLEVEPRPVEILPPPPGTATLPDERARNPVESRRGPELLPPREETGVRGDLRSPFSRPAFWGVQAVLLAGFLVAFG